jgi:hypothetical protein
MPSETPTIEVAPAPWTLKGTIYLFFLYSTSNNAKFVSSKKEFLFSPLEAASPFSDGEFVGGLGIVQVIHYSDSLVGPYDELLVILGKFKYSKPHGGLNQSSVSQTNANIRVTRIYVSQIETC